jgi:S-formylglutathione hydrolase FrmB
MDGRARRLLAAVLLAFCLASAAQASDSNPLIASLSGQIVDYTYNHGSDRRFWSKTLALPRDAYVYVPPGYDPSRAYPLFVWIHGFGGDEEQFTRQVVRALDASIVSGEMPPVIAVSPDCSIPSWWKPWKQGSWCINSREGRWEDYLIEDLLEFITSRYKIRPEPEARVIAGWSMGGFAAYSLGFKHPDKFRVLVGVYPSLNIRYADKDGRWGTPFSPETVGALENLRWGHWLGLYPKWRFPVNAGVVYCPAWGHGRTAIPRMSWENPYELLDRLDIEPGQYEMFIAYGGQDEFHIDNQVDSFLYKATKRGLDIWVRHNPDGHHSSEYVNECMPDVLRAVGASLKGLNTVGGSAASSSARRVH